MESIAVHRQTLGWVSLALLAFCSPLYAQSENVTLVSQFGISGANDVWGYTAPDGTELAIVGTSTATVFVDVTDAAHPVEVARIDGDTSNWRDMKTYDHYAYSVNESGGGIQVFDLGDPQSPVLVGNVDQDFTSSHNIFVDAGAGVLYAVGSDRGTVEVGTLLYDVATDPSRPQLITTWNERYVHDIFARDGLAFAACINSRTLVILDVSNLPVIEMRSETGYSGAFTHNTWLTDDGRYCITTDELSAGHLHIFNVEDPGAPFEVSTWRNPDEPRSIVHNVAIRDGFAFTSWYSSGLQIIDVSDPLNPVRAGFYDTFPGNSGFNGAWGVYPYAESGNLYVSDRSQGLFVFQFEGERGQLTGTVIDYSSRRPLPGVTLEFPEEQFQIETTADGTFSVRLSEGFHRFEVNSFGYEPYVAQFDLAAGGDRKILVELLKKPLGIIAGTLTDVDGTPGANVEVTLKNTPLRALSDDKGRFSFPSVPVGSYELEIDRFGYSAAATEVSVYFGQTTAANVLLFSARLAEDFETEQGWTVGGAEDTAVQGIWERGNPNGTWRDVTSDGRTSGPVQPEDDHSALGENAFVTGNGKSGTDIGVHDVDGGRSSLVSPRLDISSLSRPLLVFHLWFRNDAGANPNEDPFLVDVSSDDGLTWTNVETVFDSSEEWVRREVDLSPSVTPTSEFRIRFVAVDEGAPSVVEAAVDDLEIFDMVSRVKGTVRDENGPVEDVLVDFGVPASMVQTGADGRFELILPRGEYNLVSRSFGYEEQSSLVEVLGREDIEIDIELEKKPVGVVRGRVVTLSGRSLVAEARVELTGTPLHTLTAVDGLFSFDVVPVGGYEIRVSREGFEPTDSRIEVVAEQLVSVELNLTPTFGTGFGSPSPNPFRDGTHLSFTLAEQSRVQLRIYDINGREVQRLADETYPVGDHQITWDGRNEEGDLLPQGIYFQRIVVGNVEKVHRLLLVR